MILPRIAIRHRKSWVLALALAGAAGFAAVALTEGGSAAPPTPSPTPSATQTVPPAATPAVTATPSPTLAQPAPTPARPTPAPPPPPAPPVPPGQKITAEAARVHTGDGDCLNVRPSPGTTFGVEPFSCLPEGTLLWFSGPAQEVDGEKWRQALGQGWVALKYTAPEKAPQVRLPAAGRVVTWQLGQYREPPTGTDVVTGTDVLVAITSLKDGAVLASYVFPGLNGGLGGRNPEISPDGRFIAFPRSAGEPGKTATIVGDLSDGTLNQIEGAYGLGWSTAGKLMLQVQSTCGQVCLVSYSIYDPDARTVTPLTTEPAQIAFVAWAIDGKAAYLRHADGRFVRVDLAGKVKPVASVAEADTVWYGDPSPDGRFILGGGSQETLNLLDIASGQLSKFRRAPQRQLPGRCGGSWSKVYGWLDSTHIFYHERSSSTKEDGITIGDLATSKRKVYPFFNVQDLTSPAPGLLSFSTWVSEPGRTYAVTFVLDTATGQAVPLITGTGAVWVK